MILCINDHNMFYILLSDSHLELRGKHVNYISFFRLIMRNQDTICRTGNFMPARVNISRTSSNAVTIRKAKH